MDALVTAGTGFVGANLVRELLADGRPVRVLARKGRDRRALEGCAVEIAEGDLLQADSLRAAVKGARRDAVVWFVEQDYAADLGEQRDALACGTTAGACPPRARRRENGGARGPCRGPRS